MNEAAHMLLGIPVKFVRRNGVGVKIPEESAIIDSHKNHGAVKHAIREVKAKIRTLKKQVDGVHKVECGVDNLIYPCLVDVD